MTYRVRYTEGARTDLLCLVDFLAGNDLAAATRAYHAIVRATTVLEEFPFTCRKAEPRNPFLREFVIPFGSTGYIALFEIEDRMVTILAVRHQREDDYFG